MNQRFFLLLSTAGNMEEARSIAEHLVSQHLAACVNIVPQLTSVYWWDSRVTTDNEFLLIIKTVKEKIPDVEQAVLRLHSYETPELIALPIEYGNEKYLKWLASSVEISRKPTQ